MQPQTVEYYNLIELLELMEANGSMSYRSVWKDYIIPFGVRRDTIYQLNFDYYEFTIKESVYKQYFAGVNELLGLPADNSSLWVKASW